MSVRWWRIVREPSVRLVTMGMLYMEGAWFSSTLEDQTREVPGQPVAQWKVPKETAIPQGLYRVRLTLSNRFQRLTPEIMDVPGFAGIRMHRGNVIGDTEGCPIVGFGRGHDPQGTPSILGGTSKPAEDEMVARLRAIESAGATCWVAVENPPTYPE